MPDTLRDRIAAVDEQHNQLIATLADGWKCSCGAKFAKALQMVVMREWRLHKADAVIAELLPEREGLWGWIDGTVSTNPQTGNPIKLEIEPGEVNPLSVEDALQVGLALLAAVIECEEPK